MATIVMESAKVIEAAQRVIDQVLSREEAIAKLDRGAENTFLGGWRSQYAWGDLAKAKALLKLAQHGDPVTLNCDDIEVLF